MPSPQVSPESSPNGSEEKAGLEKDGNANHFMGEEVEDARESGRRESESIRQERSRKTSLHPPLKQTRSHSSARSGRSYTDGYSHSEHRHDEDKQERETCQPPEDGKEFEVQFDGRLRPLEPQEQNHSE